MRIVRYFIVKDCHLRLGCPRSPEPIILFLFDQCKVFAQSLILHSPSRDLLQQEVKAKFAVWRAIHHSII